jgi:Calx-beta domain
LVPTIVISRLVGLWEGNVGAAAAVFTVRLSAASTETVSVHYATADGSATAADNDYQTQSGTLTFAPVETSKTITVLVNGDRLGEPVVEHFFVNLSAATNAVIADGQGQGSILDDEPRIGISDVTRTEGNTGTTQFAFTVSLSAASDPPVTVSFATADGFATAGSDYQATSGTLTIPAGQTSGTISVLVYGDRLAEPEEAFAVNLSNPVNAGIADSQGVGIILDDEPRISISDVTKLEGKKGQTTLCTFTVTLSTAYDQAVTMSFRSVDGSANTRDSDYIAKTGTLTFAPGETTKTITIEVKGDSKKEANETFYLDLFGNSGNSLFTKNRGIGTILNDD